MDLEQRVERLEEELRHERVMRELKGEELKTHDASLRAIIETLGQSSRIVKETAVQMQQTQVEMRELRALVKELIQGLLHGRQNGSPEP